MRLHTFEHLWNSQGIDRDQERSAPRQGCDFGVNRQSSGSCYFEQLSFEISASALSKKNVETEFLKKLLMPIAGTRPRREGALLSDEARFPGQPIP